MNIGIDIDDTIMDTFDYLMPFVAEYFNADLEELQKRNISYSTLPEAWQTRELDFCKKYYDKVVPHTPIKPDALCYIRKIKELGHSVFIITARDDRLYTNAYKTTQEQLNANGIPYDKLLCAFDKAQACKDENIALFIDDSVGNCQKVLSTGIPVLLFSSKGNIHTRTDLRRVADWKEVYERIKEFR